MGGLERARIPFIVQSRPGFSAPKRAQLAELQLELVESLWRRAKRFGCASPGSTSPSSRLGGDVENFAGWHATASSFTKQGIARGRDEQRCFRRVQNYFGVLREKELFERPFFFSPQASPAEHLQVNEVDHLRDSMFCVCFWRDVEEQWKDKSSKNRHSINGERTS